MGSPSNSFSGRRAAHPTGSESRRGLAESLLEHPRIRVVHGILREADGMVEPEGGFDGRDPCEEEGEKQGMGNHPDVGVREENVFHQSEEPGLGGLPRLPAIRTLSLQKGPNLVLVALGLPRPSDLPQVLSDFQGNATGSRQ